MRNSAVLFAGLLAISGVLVLFPSCGKNRAYEKEFTAALEAMEGAELFGELMELDERYPDTFDIKYKIGEALLMAGETARAEPYLKRAEERIGDAANDAARGDLWIALGVIAFENKKYDEAIALAERGQKTEQQPGERGAAFLKARSLYMLGRTDEAAAIYNATWDARERMSRMDLNIYFELCIKAKSLTRALETLDFFQEQFEFAPGQGLQASAIYEELGMIDESVLAAAMELEYLLCGGSVDRVHVRSRLADIGVRLENRTLNPKGLGKALVKGLIAFFNADWAGADRVFSTLASSRPYFSYLTGAAKLEAFGADVERLKAYAAVEKPFRSFAAYYYHCWRGMKKGSGDYGIDTARTMLEQTIVLAPGSDYARESRRELGALLDLGPAAGDKLLLPSELDPLAARLRRGDGPELLAPVLELVSLPDNIYSMQGMIFLGVMADALPSVKVYLQMRRAQASGRLKERLTLILTE